ncbi:glycoside hydrolase family 43 protein [Schleiferilactobacillus shenzhenensis]|uniref:Uncharacterized protein n=1 Tax=Schleiferilactobacillus shenzhenensis LY-73 TaxID=1231336 RepID=U4THT6_9LACO|nr:glycoside hydrolase family 43 protein [Schleiferilactobacillus shenzhenensis]ERL63734.1 hypothetical protein L248_2231 [Schleiferilactobacillus shenzhenensis LY-73]
MNNKAGMQKLILAVIATMVLLIGGCALNTKTSTKTVTFTNPLSTDGGVYSDPWLIRVGKEYYYCGSDGKSQITIKKSNAPTDILEQNDHVVWQAPDRSSYSSETWAPELHYLSGRWYIYFAADDGENANHRMYALAGGTNFNDPLDGKYSFQGKVADDTNRWAIDGTVLTIAKKLYFVWSGWAGEQNVAQNLYIAPMSDPVTISGTRVLISAPTEPWERNGEPFVNEGPEVLTHEGQVTLIYSASGSWTDNYCLGQLTLKGKNPLKPSNWVKRKSGPVFKKTNQVFGPGHASFISSPDGTPWIMYHAAKVKGSGWDRDIRLQPFSWNSDGTPSFGKPEAPGKKISYSLN